MGQNDVQKAPAVIFHLAPGKAVDDPRLAVVVLAAALTWQSWVDVLPLTAMVLGTAGMFLLRAKRKYPKVFDEATTKVPPNQ